MPQEARMDNALPTTGGSSPEASQYEAFSYESHSSPQSRITVHYCRDLPSFTTAVDLLRGECCLGIDIEHEPSSGGKRSTYQKSDFGQQLDREADLEADQVYSQFQKEHPDLDILRKYKGDRTSGFAFPNGDYIRLTRYTKTKLSVLQIASSRHIIVAHLAAFPTDRQRLDAADFIPPALRAIFEDVSVLKLGVNIAGIDSDMARCSRYFDMPSHSLLELGELHDVLEPPVEGQPKQMVGLKMLAEKYLHRTIAGKVSGSTTTSGWQSPHPFSEEQLNYAANDAFIAVKIHEAMMEKHKALSPTVDLPALKSQPPFDYQEYLKQLVTRLKASKNRKAKQKLYAILDITPPTSTALVIPEGMSRGQVLSRNRRLNFAPEDLALANALTILRNKLLEAEYELNNADFRLRWLILEDKYIDRLSVAYPRPQTQREVLAILPPRMRGNFEYAEEFIEVICEHPPPPGKIAALQAAAQDALPIAGHNTDTAAKEVDNGVVEITGAEGEGEVADVGFEETREVAKAEAPVIRVFKLADCLDELY